jgi:hypothetical protein
MSFVKPAQPSISYSSIRLLLYHQQNNRRDLELRNSNGNGLIFRVADADVDLLYADAGGFLLSMTVELLSIVSAVLHIVNIVGQKRT